ncbi:MAG: DUF6175 family protein [Candidatus Theseobacter exili]|nr:DUF6175 family protein [Candidatus Theseobacter exili]
MKKILIVVLLIINVCLFGQANLPRSHEAVLIEVTSPSEVIIRATGYGIDKKHRKPRSKVLDKSANTDAMKAAVWFVLLGGSDPLIQTDEEKAAFEKIQEEFFTKSNIRNFIAWEAEYYDKRLKIEGGKKLKIEKTYKINKALITESLVDKGVLSEESTIAGLAGLPSIMVIPEAKGEMVPIELLKTDPNLKKGAEVIESYLTARRYEVIVPEQQQVIQELTSTQYALEGAEEDYSYLLALSIGSDVYISYNVSIESRMLGSTKVKKGVVACRAYETTTGRLLGTETGYSHERTAPDAVLIEEAMNDAIDKVLSRIMNYWKKDLGQGVQYKMIVTVSDVFDTDDAENIIFSVSDFVKEVSKTYKENVVADYTYDVQLWCNPEQYKSSTDIYRYLKKNYKGNGEIKKVSISRKLILLNIVEE